MKAMLLPLVWLAAAPAWAQMEKRVEDQYDEKKFAKADPAVGKAVPNLALADLNGRPWSLHDLLGRTIVLLKGSYT